MRISDWSSDVCSSDLIGREPVEVAIADEFAGNDVTLAAAAMLFGEHRRLCNVADVDCRRADIKCCARLAGGDLAQHAAVRGRLDRTRVVGGKGDTVSVDLRGGRSINKKQRYYS